MPIPAFFSHSFLQRRCSAFRMICLICLAEEVGHFNEANTHMQNSGLKSLSDSHSINHNNILQCRYTVQ